MAKKKTVKDLNEDLKAFEERLVFLENFKEAFEKLGKSDLKNLEERIKLIDEGTRNSKIKILEDKMVENSESLKIILNEKKEIIAN